jgi:hypothetical protein
MTETLVTYWPLTENAFFLQVAETKVYFQVTKMEFMCRSLRRNEVYLKVTETAGLVFAGD